MNQYKRPAQDAGQLGPLHLLYGFFRIIGLIIRFSAIAVLTRLSLSNIYDLLRRLHERQACHRLEPFVYSDNLSSTQIRLLRVGNWRSGLLNCSLETFNLDECPQFSALSYTWQEPKFESACELWTTIVSAFRSKSKKDMPTKAPDHRLVVCDGMALFITSNLYNAIQSISSGNQQPAAYWWIDQVCINQSSIAEKNNQIPNMGEIYSQATKVVAWLGVPGIFERHLPEFLRKSFGADSNPSYFFDSIQAGVNATTIETVIGMFVLLDRSWFRRAWIVQEFILARNITFFLGTHEISLDVLVQASDGVQKVLRWLNVTSLVANMNIVTELFNARQSYDPTSGWTFEYWIQVCRGRRVSDRRDLIFAGRSLLSPTEKHRIVIDYSTDEATLFTRLTKDLLYGKKGVEALFLAERGHYSQRYKDLQFPQGTSWEVNLDYSIPYPSLTESAFCADPSRERSSCAIMRPVETAYLQNEALIIDTVESVCDPLGFTTMVDVRGFLSITLLMGEQYRWTDEHSLVALARTLTADQPTNHELSSDELIESMMGMMSTAAQHTHFRHRPGLVTNPDFDPDKPQPPTYKGLAPYDLFLGLMYAFPHHAWDEPWPRFQKGATVKDLASEQTVMGGKAIVPAGDRFYSLFTSELRGRRLFRTHKGIIGRGPASMKPGNTITILKGSRVPYVLQNGINDTPQRKMEIRQARDRVSKTLSLSSSTGVTAPVHDAAQVRNRTQGQTQKLLEQYQTLDEMLKGRFFLGEVYLHGFMNGEIRSWIDRGKVSWQTLRIG